MAKKYCPMGRERKTRQVECARGWDGALPSALGPLLLCVSSWGCSALTCFCSDLPLWYAALKYDFILYAWNLPDPRPVPIQGEQPGAPGFSSRRGSCLFLWGVLPPGSGLSQNWDSSRPCCHSGCPSLAWGGFHFPANASETPLAVE